MCEEFTRLGEAWLDHLTCFASALEVAIPILTPDAHAAALRKPNALALVSLSTKATATTSADATKAAAEASSTLSGSE